MKTIGFVDYYLDEWHANNYPIWMDEINKANGTDFKLAYGWGEIDNPNGGRTNAEWCKDFGAELCSSIEELCQKADFVLVLAPSNPETHLRLAEQVFKCGVSPYIDKTFAPDYQTAKRIFELAEKYGVTFFSSSALRYGTELKPYNGDAKAITVLGGGGSVQEYIIHQAEMVVKCLGIGATRLKATKAGDQTYFDIEYANGKSAKMTFANELPFAVAVCGKDGVSRYFEPTSTFENLIADILNFFSTGKISFDTRETLEVIKIREAAVNACDNLNEWMVL